MLTIFNQTLRTVTISLWDETTNKEQRQEIPRDHYCYPTGSDKITRVKFEGVDWIPVEDEAYSIYRDASDRLQLTEGADFCKRCLVYDGIPFSSFTNMRCEKCGEKKALRKKVERIGIETGVAAAGAAVVAIAVALFSED